MNKLIALLFLLSFTFTNAQKKLITIYDKDCGYCQDLLNKTYQDKDVKKLLKNYEHQLVEANTSKGKEFIEKYAIDSYPTQIIISNESASIIEGFMNIAQQLEFLTNSELFKTNPKDILVTQSSIVTERKIIKKSTSNIETKVDRICRKYETARTRVQDTTEAFRKLVLEAMGEECHKCGLPSKTSHSCCISEPKFR